MTAFQKFRARVRARTLAPAFRGQFSNGVKKLAQIQLSVSILKQGRRYVAYAHALDLSTSGRSEQEAKKRFAEAAWLFLEELDRAGTLGEILRELGWHHRQKHWSPPQVITQEAVGVRMPVAA